MNKIELNKLIVELKEFVENAKNKEALNLLINTTKVHPKFGHLHHDSILLKSRFTTLQRNNNLIGEKRIDDNRISKSILYLIKELGEIRVDNIDNLPKEENGINNTPALIINLQQWVKMLKQEEKDYFDKLLTNNEKKLDQYFLSSRLENLVESTLKFGLKIQTNNSIEESASTIESIEELRSNLLIELIFDPKIDNGILKWFIEKTKFAISKKKNLQLEMIDFIWERIVFLYCISISDKYVKKIYEKIIDAVLEKASNEDYELLYLFFKYFISKLGSNVDAIGFLVNRLRNHQDDLFRNNDVKTKYLERLSLIINLGVKETKFEQGKITKFSPDIVLVKCEQLPYSFYSMVFPLKNEEFDIVTETTRKVEPIYPFIFSSRNPVNQLKELLDNVNWKEKNNDYYWDIPTIYEWLILADCIENHYPWGNELPYYEIANLSYDKNIPPRRLRHSISFQKGKSKYGIIDCCGNTHELAYFDKPDYLQKHNLRLMGGCYETNWLNSSCQIIRKFVKKEDWDWVYDERRNVGIRLIKFEKKFKDIRLKTLKNYVKELNENRRVSRIGNLIPKMNPAANNG